MTHPHETWAAGAAYEAYVGRWSRPVAQAFLRWLEVPAGGRWLDVGCGTGALTATVLAVANPAEVIGVDTSEGFLAHARTLISDPRAAFHAGDARSLPLPGRRFDAVVSGLALNFVPDPAPRRDRVGPGSPRRAAWSPPTSGTTPVAWPCCATSGTPPPRSTPQRPHWTRGVVSRCAGPNLLPGCGRRAGLGEVEVRAVEVATVFAGFDDYWRPFLGGQGPAPGYLASLTEEHRRALRDLLRARLPSGPDGSIPLTARCWAVRGVQLG
ncbi:class I SAM-dependent methyltransferase [Nonomuraea dietziae]|uniref:class I SAM-dependent methyltransferase n=1 Tax=Nonomuraea dietziae TaxID=65515 RepID=UPI0031CE8F52